MTTFKQMTSQSMIAKRIATHPIARTAILWLAVSATQCAFAQTAPPPAFGQEPTTPPVTQAPPVTTLDEPSLEPSGAVRSYLKPGVHLTETVNSNLGDGQAGGGGVVGISRVLGSLDMKRLWSRYDFSVDYIGGLSLYSDSFGQPSQTHSLDASQRYSWRTGQIQVCDALSFLQEGSFSHSGGAAGGSCGGSGSSTGGTFGVVGNSSRITNTTSVDIRDSLSPRSTVTLAGDYGFTNFLNGSTSSNTATGTSDSRQLAGTVGYNRNLNRFDQLGVSYGYQRFQFPTPGAVNISANVFQVLYAHQVSGRMSLVLGAGPQITTIGANSVTKTPSSSILNANVRASLKYRFTRTSLDTSFSRYTSSGSGLQLGSNSNVARAALSRPLSRLWNGSLDVGYSHHTALQAGHGRSVGGSFQDGFGGAGVTRRLGRFFSLAFHYQYSYEYFGGSSCQSGLIDCSRSFNRHIGDVTLSWHPSPIRLD